ncbi:hypothetical protein ACFFRE_07910 [Aciditerrimonas ferrireducens]|jgi:hypothetical protein|uniref:Secreted protein n=1 Tax=Aciditerrimonas ferrireducens TaxID=667306 RepID=A0ABV6C319_9ACTN|nr:hypothetical protein [Aciditerrimonas ferrireducens]MCK4176841.1 hypothetical protein [Aciditerrimonas ferrireducens]
MAVVEPKPSRREQTKMALGMAAGGLIGAVLVGIVAPIVLAMLVGAIWGGH